MVRLRTSAYLGHCRRFETVDARLGACFLGAMETRISADACEENTMFRGQLLRCSSCVRSGVSL